MDSTLEALWRKKADSRIVFNERFLQEQIDFRTTIAKLTAKNPDVVVLALAPGTLSAFVKQARELHLPGEIAGVETFEDESEVKASEGGLVGAWYVNASDPTDRFTKLYKEKNGDYPGWASANGFDAITLLAQGAAAGGSDNDKIRGYLYGIKDFKGAAGQYSASGDGRFLLPPALKRVSEIGFISIQSSAPKS
jgi:branched-chain amino acid transport system substrate-binding protein